MYLSNRSYHSRTLGSGNDEEIVLTRPHNGTRLQSVYSQVSPESVRALRRYDVRPDPRSHVDGRTSDPDTPGRPVTQNDPITTPGSNLDPERRERRGVRLPQGYTRRDGRRLPPQPCPGHLYRRDGRGYVEKNYKRTLWVHDSRECTKRIANPIKVRVYQILQRYPPVRDFQEEVIERRQDNVVPRT